MKLTLLLLLCGACTAQNLPDAPSRSMTHGADMVQRDWEVAHHPKIFDWTFVTAHGIFLAAVVADIEVTHAGIAGRGHCSEGNDSYPLHPSRGEMYRNEGIIYAAITGFDFAIKRFAIPGGRWISIGGPVYGTVIHGHGAYSWFSKGCF